MSNMEHLAEHSRADIAQSERVRSVDVLSAAKVVEACSGPGHFGVRVAFGSVFDDELMIREAAEKYLGSDASAFLRLLQPAAFLDQAVEGSSSGYLGGCPQLDAGQPWPEWHGRPLSSLITLELSHLVGIDTGLNLPTTGVLNFFYEASAQTWGFDPADRGSWAVLHSIDGSETPAPSNAAEFTSCRSQLTRSSASRTGTKTCSRR
jgi:hypothetical protein